MFVWTKNSDIYQISIAGSIKPSCKPVTVTKGFRLGLVGYQNLHKVYRTPNRYFNQITTISIAGMWLIKLNFPSRSFKFNIFKISINILFVWTNFSNTYIHELNLQFWQIFTEAHFKRISPTCETKVSDVPGW